MLCGGGRDCLLHTVRSTGGISSIWLWRLGALDTCSWTNNHYITFYRDLYLHVGIVLGQKFW